MLVVHMIDARQYEYDNMNMNISPVRKVLVCSRSVCMTGVVSGWSVGVTDRAVRMSLKTGRSCFRFGRWSLHLKTTFERGWNMPACVAAMADWYASSNHCSVSWNPYHCQVKSSSL